MHVEHDVDPVLGGVLDRHPALDVCLSHGGGAVADVQRGEQSRCGRVVDVDDLEALVVAARERGLLTLGAGTHVLRLTPPLTINGEEIDEALAAIAETGWRDWNLDLVFGIPGQTWTDAASDLEAALTAGPTHMSLYDLTYTAAYNTHVEKRCGSEARASRSSLSISSRRNRAVCEWDWSAIRATDSE